MNGMGRTQYAVWGIILMAVKQVLDRAIAAWFHRPWTFASYWLRIAEIRRVPGPDRGFVICLALTSLPFAIAGVLLTIRRLRTIGWPNWLVVLFFVPGVNVMFFLLLLVVPDRERSAPRHTLPPPGRLQRYMPEGGFGSAVASIIVTALLACVLALFPIRILGTYGWGVFAAIPFTQGLVAAVLYGLAGNRTVGQSVVVALLALLLTGAILVAFAVEGMLCLLMAIPLALPLSILGAVVGHSVIVSSSNPRERIAMMCLPVLFFSPAVAGLETRLETQAPVFAVRTSIVVNAPPAVVWRHVVSFSDLPAPKEWLFRSGIAYPMRARIEGRGAGAIRYCEFSTGPFVEPIETWNEPELLQFSVTHNPEPMREMTPYAAIHPPHLNGFLVSRRGQFALKPLAGDRTMLEGTTWYQHHLWPAAYWRIWSDQIIHRIHLRVLDHIRNLSENSR